VAKNRKVFMVEDGDRWWREFCFVLVMERKLGLWLAWIQVVAFYRKEV
jgi:hypothetical protein